MIHHQMQILQAAAGPSKAERARLKKAVFEVGRIMWKVYV